MDISDIRRANLRILIAEVGSKAELGRRIGKPANYLSQVESKTGRQSRSIGPTLARKLERATERDPGWMDQDHTERAASEVSAGAAGKPRLVRIIRWDQVTGRGASELNNYDDGAAGSFYVSDSVSESAFALRVQGDSMTNAAGGMSFPVGCVIVVDPEVPAVPGDHVIVELPGVRDAVFKTLESDGAQQFLKPLNPRYPITPMPRGARILGVVVGVHISITPGSRA